MPKPRKICVLTGSRSEYGLLYWLMKEISAQPDLQLQVLATGAHFSPEFGSTYQQIEADGFSIDYRLEMLLSGDSPLAITKSLGLGVIGFADAFAQLKPDLVVILGDRFEALAGAQAAMLASIPIAHLHGGELSHGSLDDSIRHAITKMAHVHFAATESYRNRIVQLGEQPDRVFMVGAIGLDHLSRGGALDYRPEFDRRPGRSSREYLLALIHPSTAAPDETKLTLSSILRALEELAEYDLLIIHPGADIGSSEMLPALRDFAKRHPERVQLRVNLSRHDFLSAMKHSALMIGNSSSGVIEAPALGVPSVDVGSRQSGRSLAASVIHCDSQTEAVRKAIQHALSLRQDAALCSASLNYAHGETSQRIVNILATIDLDRLRKKVFYDLYDSPGELDEFRAPLLAISLRNEIP